MRYRKFQGTVDIVATTGLHLKNTQLQTDVQKNFQTKFVALLLQMPTSNRYELPADTCHYVVKRSVLIRKEVHANLRYRKFQGSVDIVATTGLHLKNTQVQADVQKNCQTNLLL